MVRVFVIAAAFVFSCLAALPSVDAIQQNPLCEALHNPDYDPEARNDEAVDQGDDRTWGLWVFAGTYDPDSESGDYKGVRAWTGTVCSMIDGVV